MSSSQHHVLVESARRGAQARSASVSPGETGARTLPELLAPAGDWECARAAVENGADAIYFGLERFNARMRAHNFTEPDLPALMAYLHRRGVKGYVTFNTLVFENELAEAEQYARAIIAAGADAAIVQDVGICRLIRRLSPDFPIHVSTQMTITSLGGIDFARELGCNLVVLARECSLKDIESMVAGEECQGTAQAADLASPSPCHPPQATRRLEDGTDGTNGTNEGASPSTAIASSPVPRHASLPLEVFVHGALCVAYSGQCLTSEALGGRSANRGECAQACRMPYDLISDGQPVPLGDRKYLLSPQDLAGLEVLPELTRLRVAALKIEGRLKSPEYVANITRIYRAALEGAVASIGQKAISGSGEGRRATNDTERYEMEMAFSRGLYSGWFRGINNQELVHGRFGKKRGVYLGEVAEVRRDGVVVHLEGPLKPGDGLVFDAAKPEEKEEGGRVYEIHELPSAERRQGNGKPRGKARLVRLTFGRGDIDFSRVHPGDRLWKTSDPELERRLRQSFAGDTPKFQRPISFEVHGLAGRPLTLLARDELGHSTRLDSAMPLAQAEKHPLTIARLEQQLGRLGGTVFRLGALRSFLEGDVLLPISELNRLRREAVAELERLRAQPLRWTLVQEVPAGASLESDSREAAELNPASPPQLTVLVRNLSQLEAVLPEEFSTLYCDFENPKHYRDAVARFRSAPRAPGAALFVAPPRVFKMGEDWILKQVRSCEADGYLLRNYDHLKFFANDRRIGDYSLNIANRLAADYFKNRFGLERLTASYDLNFTQLEALLQAAPPAWFEVTIYQHIPMFHMEHCLFCAFLSQGTDYTNCGRPCDRHEVMLRDRVGVEHPVKADAGCRNTVFNGRAQTGAEYVARLLALGVRQFRLEFTNETPALVRQTIAKYRQLLRGEISGAQVWRELKLFPQLGVTRGQLGVGAGRGEPRSRKV